MSEVQSIPESAESPERSRARRDGFELLFGTGLLMGLMTIGLRNYLLFHVLAEGFSIAVATGIFLITWNSRDLVKSPPMLILGVGYGFVALIDLLHTLAYSGMGVFATGGSANLATQLWVAARVLQAGVLIAAFTASRRSARPPVVLGTCAAIAGVLIWLIFAGWFPDTWRADPAGGGSLTPFKIGVELGVVAALLVAIGLARRCRKHLGRTATGLLAASVAVTIASEAAFMLYDDPEAVPNMIGHFLKIVAFFLIYRVLIQTGLREPFSLLFRDLKRRERELSGQREFLDKLLENAPVGVGVLNLDSYRFLYVNPAAEGIPRESEGPLLGRTFAEAYPEVAPKIEPLLGEVVRTGKPMRLEEFEARLGPEHQQTFWNLELIPLCTGDGEVESLLTIARDVTASHLAVEERDRLVGALRRSRDVLEQRVAERTAEAEQRARQLQAMALELTQAEQRERRRLAQVLHDHLQQLLVGARFHLEIITGRTGDEQLSQALDQVDKLLIESIDASRSLTYDLSPPILYDEGLLAGLRWLARWMEQKHQVHVEIRAEQGAEPAREPVSAFLFQAVRELLFNVVKHAKAPAARVDLEREADGMLVIYVSDEGIGFTPAPAQPEPPHRLRAPEHPGADRAARGRHAGPQQRRARDGGRAARSRDRRRGGPCGTRRSRLRRRIGGPERSLR